MLNFITSCFNEFCSIAGITDGGQNVVYAFIEELLFFLTFCDSYSFKILFNIYGKSYINYQEREIYIIRQQDKIYYPICFLFENEEKNVTRKMFNKKYIVIKLKYKKVK